VAGQGLGSESARRAFGKVHVLAYRSPPGSRAIHAIGRMTPANRGDRLGWDDFLAGAFIAPPAIRFAAEPRHDFG